MPPLLFTIRIHPEAVAQKPGEQEVNNPKSSKCPCTTAPEQKVVVTAEGEYGADKYKLQRKTTCDRGQDAQHNELFAGGEQEIKQDRGVVDTESEDHWHEVDEKVTTEDILDGHKSE